MRVAIAGAGAVGRSIALELVDNNHQVMLIERELSNIDPESVEAAEWVHADACELASLEEAGLETCDVVIAATGDDKVNLVVSLLAKTEFAVRRVVARVNDPTQRVAVRAELGRGRRGVHAAPARRARRGGGGRRRPGAADDVPAGPGQPGGGHAARGHPARRAGRGRAEAASPTRRWWWCCAEAG